MCKNAVCYKAGVPILLRLHVGMFGWLVCCLTSRSRIFCWYEDVIGLQISTYTRHLWPLSSGGSFACHTYCDTRHPYILLLGFEHPTFRMRGERFKITDYATTAAQGLRGGYLILNSADGNLARVSIYFQWCQFICASKLMKNVGFDLSFYIPQYEYGTAIE